jgi:hypothetical protein
LRTDPLQITAITLLDKALEFESMTSDRTEWKLEKLKDNPPRFVRLQQLIVLLKLFTPETFNNKNIGLSIDSLFNGDFILQRDIIKYAALCKTMDEVIISVKYFPKKQTEWETRHLQHNFTNAIDFKRKINKVLGHNDGIMEISYPYFYSIILTSEIAGKLNTQENDKFLSLVIDPLKNCYEKDWLIRELDYPKDDVYDIDLDYW